MKASRPAEAMGGGLVAGSLIAHALEPVALLYPGEGTTWSGEPADP